MPSSSEESEPKESKLQFRQDFDIHSVRVTNPEAFDTKTSQIILNSKQLIDWFWRLEKEPVKKFAFSKEFGIERPQNLNVTPMNTNRTSKNSSDLTSVKNNLNISQSTEHFSINLPSEEEHFWNVPIVWPILPRWHIQC